MSELPQVGQTYTHRTYGEICLDKVCKRGRGYYVVFASTDPSHPLFGQVGPHRQRLKDFVRESQP